MCINLRPYIHQRFIQIYSYYISINTPIHILTFVRPLHEHYVVLQTRGVDGGGDVAELALRHALEG